ncbi:fimbrial protein [Paraburkholderia sp. C35]|uniref:fimbrial protein n=1 Tax=Paraburkholderia sp. C35 TaxID=2126993 RepID=UPI000D696C60|nr:fimbrial protein [Paraburkholderia sp. C35]
MNARTYALSERAVTDCFVLATQADEHARWLSDSLIAAGAVEPVSLDPHALAQRIGTLNPSLVFVDFSGGHIAAASAAANAARSAFPGLQIVALGSVREPESALAALRAGVRDFVDLCAPVADALRITRAVLDNIVEPVSRHGKLTALIGARIGMGVSTLAANLSVLLQRRDAAQGREALLLDLGLPAGDGTLLLNTKSEFCFVEAVRNVRRFDQTFVHTALSHHDSGLALTTLPADLGDMREVSHASSVGLLNRLRAFFDQQIVDLGGFTNSEFIANVVQAADETWLVCDQGGPSVVSAVSLLDGLREHGIEADKLRQKLRLVVTKAAPELGLSPAQIAQRLELELIATLPERRVALGQAMNQGHLLAESAPRDPYVRALDALVTRLAGVSAAHGATGAQARLRKTAAGGDAGSPGQHQQSGTRGKAALDAFRRFLPTSSKRS